VRSKMMLTWLFDRVSQLCEENRRVSAPMTPHAINLRPLGRSTGSKALSPLGEAAGSLLLSPLDHRHRFLLPSSREGSAKSVTSSTRIWLFRQLVERLGSPRSARGLFCFARFPFVGIKTRARALRPFYRERPRTSKAASIYKSVCKPGHASARYGANSDSRLSCAERKPPHGGSCSRENAPLATRARRFSTSGNVDPRDMPSQ
jgi:hypothetical protein